MITQNEQTEMSPMRSGHWCRRCGERWSGHEPRQGGGGTPEREEGRLAEGQAEEKDLDMIGNVVVGLRCL
jgi:hypothetical protein